MCVCVYVCVCVCTHAWDCAHVFLNKGAFRIVAKEAKNNLLRSYCWYFPKNSHSQNCPFADPYVIGLECNIWIYCGYTFFFKKKKKLARCCSLGGMRTTGKLPELNSRNMSSNLNPTINFPYVLGKYLSS